MALFREGTGFHAVDIDGDRTIAYGFDTTEDYSTRKYFSIRNRGSEIARLTGDGSWIGGTTQFDVRFYGAVGDGVTDDTAAVQAAYTAADSVSGTVLFPPGGTYRITSTVSVPSGVKTVAYGATFTGALTSDGFFRFYSASHTDGLTELALTANANIGDASVSVSAPNAATLAANDIVHIKDDVADGGVEYQREVNVVASVSGTTVNLKYPLNFNYTTAQNAYIAKLTVGENTEWRGGTFDLSATSSGDADAITGAYLHNCRIYDVTVENHRGMAIELWDSLACKIQGVRALNPEDTSAGHGYGARFQYCRHSTIRDVFAETCRHAADITGGSDCLIADVHSVGDATAAVFVHGLRAKRITIISPTVVDAVFGVAMGNGSFGPDHDVTVIGGQFYGCTTTIYATDGCTNVKILDPTIRRSVERAIAIDGCSEVEIVGPMIDGITTNPGSANYGAITIASSSNDVRIVRPFIRNPIYSAINFRGSGDFEVIQPDIVQSAAAAAIDASSAITGTIRIAGGRIAGQTTSDLISLQNSAGTPTLFVVENMELVGDGATPASGAKLQDATRAVFRNNRVQGVSECVRFEDVAEAWAYGNSFEPTSGNGIKTVGTMTALYEWGNRFDCDIDIADDAGALAGARRIAFTANDATPSVKNHTYFRTANTGATTITDFDDGHLGKEIFVEIGDANTTIDFTSSGLKGNAGVDWSPTTGDHMRCVYNGTDWLCEVSDNTA